jgi:hypothetical protein
MTIIVYLDVKPYVSDLSGGPFASNISVDYREHESLWFRPKHLHVFAILLGVIRPAGSNIQAQVCALCSNSECLDVLKGQ